MAFTASVISIRMSGHLFTCTPMACYEVSANTIDTVVMYRLKHEFNDITEETLIPYYKSIGETNRLDADMLFPFMCFTSMDTDPPTCPYVPVNSGLSNLGLIKYNFIKHINLNGIIKSLEDAYPDKEREGESCYLKGIYALQQIANHNSRGITSIFIRIQNVLDFIISISCKKLRDRFCSGCGLAKKTMAKYVCQECGLKLCHEHTLEHIETSGHVLQLMNKEFIPKGNPGPFKYVLQYEQLYRICVVNKLYEMIQAIEDSGLVTFRDKTLPIQSVSYVEFNELVNVCANPAEHQMKLLFYKRISNALYYQFASILTKDEFPYLLPHIDSVRDNEELNTELSMWKASCSRLDITLSSISRINPKYVLENLKTVPKILEAYKNRPKEVILISQEFLPKIKDYLSNKSKDESLSIIDSFYDILIKLYMPYVSEQKSIENKETLKQRLYKIFS